MSQRQLPEDQRPPSIFFSIPQAAVITAPIANMLEWWFQDLRRSWYTRVVYPVTFLEFQAADGSGTWNPYVNKSPPFSFENVYEQKTKTLKMRLTNKGGNDSASLSVTVSKPPFGVIGTTGAQDQVDLDEGRILTAGQSATANLYCSVAKSHVNVDSYNGTAQWTMNTGDTNFGKHFVQFTSNASAESWGPFSPNGSATYRYNGCWK